MIKHFSTQAKQKNYTTHLKELIVSVYSFLCVAWCERDLRGLFLEMAFTPISFENFPVP